MSTMQYFGGFASEAAWIKRLAQEQGVTTEQILLSDINIFSLLLSHSEPQPGWLEGVFRGGLTMLVDYTVGTGGDVTVGRVEIRLDGQTESVWSGNMSVTQFVSDIWPATQINGSADTDWLFANSGDLALGNAGHDIIEMWGGAAAGGAGSDHFVIFDGHSNKIHDFGSGDKVVFPMFENIDELIANVASVIPDAAGGFSVHFVGHATQPRFSVTFENFSLEQLRAEDVLVGLTGMQTAYTPLARELGVDVGLFV